MLGELGRDRAFFFFLPCVTTEIVIGFGVGPGVFWVATRTFLCHDRVFPMGMIFLLHIVFYTVCAISIEAVVLDETH